MHICGVKNITEPVPVFSNCTTFLFETICTAIFRCIRIPATLFWPLEVTRFNWTGWKLCNILLRVFGVHCHWFEAWSRWGHKRHCQFPVRGHWRFQGEPWLPAMFHINLLLSWWLDHFLAVGPHRTREKGSWRSLITRVEIKTRKSKATKNTN